MYTTMETVLPADVKHNRSSAIPLACAVVLSAFTDLHPRDFTYQGPPPLIFQWGQRSHINFMGGNSLVTRLGEPGKEASFQTVATVFTAGYNCLPEAIELHIIKIGHPFKRG